VDVFERLESEVRSYSRDWPTVFTRARGTRLWDEQGRSYLDFFAGAGALNYGHNPPALKSRLLEYLAGDGVVHGLDTMTVAKRAFLERFDELILRPRGLEYKVQFTGPTGTNAVEASLKLARKVTGRTQVLAFTNGFHGMTLGALAVTSNPVKRAAAGVPLRDVVRVPYGAPDVFGHLADAAGTAAQPAAVILETVQGEGGVHPASAAWLQEVATACERHGVLLIVDDIQVGCGRTGAFFSFEEAGLQPDIVALSKSLSGYGLPMAVVLLRPEHDVWKPGEHNGTFRGNNAAFVTATGALEEFWADGALSESVSSSAAQLRSGLDVLVARSGGGFTEARGRGLIQGLVAGTPELAKAICFAAFERGLLVETAGVDGDVVKFLPPLTATAQEIDEALSIVTDALASKGLVASA